MLNTCVYKPTSVGQVDMQHDGGSDVAQHPDVYFVMAAEVSSLSRRWIRMAT